VRLQPKRSQIGRTFEPQTPTLPESNWLVAWELFMRGAGRSERTVTDGIATVRRPERAAGKVCTDLDPVDVSRFLADRRLGVSSRAAYFGSISAFSRWWSSQGGATSLRDYPARGRRNRRPGRCPGPGCERCSIRECTSGPRVMILLAALAGLRAHEIAKVRGHALTS
jgi:integrase/recombinase XerD